MFTATAHNGTAGPIAGPMFRRSPAHNFLIWKSSIVLPLQKMALFSKNLDATPHVQLTILAAPATDPQPVAQALGSGQTGLSAFGEAERGSPVISISGEPSTSKTPLSEVEGLGPWRREDRGLPLGSLITTCSCQQQREVAMAESESTSPSAPSAPNTKKRKRSGDDEQQTAQRAAAANAAAHTRTMAACDACRVSKTRCDAARPVCAKCQKRGRTCVYPDKDPSTMSDTPRATSPCPLS